MPDAGSLTDASASLTEFEAFMEAAVDAIVVIEASGRISGFSRSAEEMFGYQGAEVLGKQVDELMPEPYRSQHAGYISRYLKTGSAKIIGTGREVHGMRKDKSVFPIWLSVGEIRSGNDHRFVGIIRDLSEHHAAELERRTLETRLEHVSRLSLLGEMAAGIAHEINQPLTAIANYSHAAKKFLDREDPGPETLRVACEGIADQVQRAGDVISNLRGFLRKREVRTNPLDARKLIEDVMVLIKADAAHEGVTIETEFADSLPEISGNAVQLQQVLLNLTRNAVDAMSTNLGRSKVLRIETRLAPDDRVELRVSDRGPGIPDSLKASIFNPFFTTKKEGLGVGLAISRSIVDAHHGELKCEPREGGGTVFIVSLPVIR